MLDQLKEYWNGLPKWAKIGVPAAALGLFVWGRIHSGSQSVPVTTANQVTDGTTGAKVSDAQLAYQMDQFQSGLADKLTQGLTSSIAYMQDDLTKQSQQNATAAAQFQQNVNAQIAAIQQPTHAPVVQYAQQQPTYSPPVAVGSGSYSETVGGTTYSSNNPTAYNGGGSNAPAYYNNGEPVYL